MRLAILADIHALLPALDAALAEIETLQVDGIIVAGDMLAGPNQLETLKRLQELGCWMIRGNNENYLLRFLSGDAPDWWHTSQQWAFMRWNFQQLDRQSLEWIASLPEQRTIHLSGTHPIRVVHGSPRNISELIYPDKDLASLDLALAQVPEPVVIFGHTHLSWQMRRQGRLALNPGALSCNFVGKICGGYAILDWENDHWRAELRKFDLDLNLVRKSFLDSGLLEAGGAFAGYWLRSIETGVDLLPRFVDFAFELARGAGYVNSPFVPDHIWEQADSLFAAELQKTNPTFDLSEI